MPNFSFHHQVFVMMTCACFALLISPLAAQTTEIQPGEEIFQILTPRSKIRMITLDSQVVELPSRIKIVDGFNAELLTVTALSANQLRIHADAPGVTTVKMIDEFDSVYSIEVFVEPDTRELRAYLERLFPGSAIEVVGLRDGVVLRGWVTEPSQIPQIIEIAEQFTTTVHNQLSVAGASQVQLYVKVIEVQRTKLRELGFNMLMIGQNYLVSNNVSGLAPLASVTVPFGGPVAGTVNSGALSNPELQFAVAGNTDIFQGFIKALQSEALAKILAEPVLVTTSGRPASMLSGGEFPILVPGGVGAATIQWREFGVRLEMVPIVLGNGRLRLDVAPEVSDRDFSNAVSLDGFVVPGITVRRVNTQVEMHFGETLMVGGLISQRRNGTTQKVPFLGELPWIGAAFSRKTYSVGETELLILVTPQRVAPMAPHQLPPGGPGLYTDDPVDRELYIDGFLEVPKYGPECPECESQLYLPPGVVAPGAEAYPHAAPNGEIPALTPISGQKSNPNVQQAVGNNPFRVQVDKDVSEVRTTTPPAQKNVSLPGLYTPRGNAPSTPR